MSKTKSPTTKIDSNFNIDILLEKAKNSPKKNTKKQIMLGIRMDKNFKSELEEAQLKYMVKNKIKISLNEFYLKVLEKGLNSII